MKGDFSRLTFDRKKHYSDVLLQQGRVLLDADWNEQQRITRYRAETETADAIGPSGVPASGGLNILTSSRARHLSIIKDSSTGTLKGWIVGEQGLIQHWDSKEMKIQKPPLGVTETLRSVCFVDEKYGWIAGDKGVILYTANGGATWVRQASKTDSNLLCIYFMQWGKAHVGCAVGTKGTFLYSLDRGQTWAKATTNVLAQLNAAHIIAVSDQNLKFFAAGNQRTILEYTWNSRTKKLTAASVTFNDPSNNKANLYAINAAFVNKEESACAAGAKGVAFYKEGTTWNAQTTGIETTIRSVLVTKRPTGTDTPLAILWNQIFKTLPFVWTAVAEDGRELFRDNENRWWPVSSVVAEKVRAVNFIDLSRENCPAMMTVLGTRGTIFNSTAGGWNRFTSIIDGLSTTAGRIYIDGILCEFENPAPLDLPSAAGKYLAYAECHRRHVSALQDEQIRETALGGPDTCTRLQTIAQVKYLQILSGTVSRKIDNLRAEAIKIADEITLSFGQKKAADAIESIGQATNAMKKMAMLDDAAMKAEFRTGSASVKKFVDAQKGVIGSSALEKVRDKFSAWEKVQSDLVQLVSANSVEDAWGKLTAGRTCALAARVTEAETPANLCKMVSGGGYSGLENQLYRVEIHQGGALKDGPTFKWSRDNGSVAFPFEFVSVNDKKTFIRLPASSPGSYYPVAKEEWIGTWVELIDDRRELAGEPGLLMQIADVPSEHEMILDGSLNAADWSDSSLHPLIRRWDSKDAAKKAGALPLVEEGWLELESGVQIRFEKGADYRTGDYWMIPARTDTADVEWPQQGGEPLPVPPRGICRHYAPLAYLTAYDTGKNDIVITEFSDCRAIFEPQAKRAIRIVGINWQNDSRLDYNARNLLNLFTAGLQITLDDAPDAWSVNANSFIVEMSIANSPRQTIVPPEQCDIRVSGNVVSWHFPIIAFNGLMATPDKKAAAATNASELNASAMTHLNAMFKPSASTGLTNPIEVTTPSTLFRLHITLKGSRICKSSGQQSIYLDGQAFATPRADKDANGNAVIRHDLCFPSGAGNKACDFESWLDFVSPAAAAATNKSVTTTIGKTSVKTTTRKKTGK